MYGFLNEKFLVYLADVGLTENSTMDKWCVLLHMSMLTGLFLSAGLTVVRLCRMRLSMPLLQRIAVVPGMETLCVDLMPRPGMKESLRVSVRLR